MHHDGDLEYQFVAAPSREIISDFVRVASSPVTPRVMETLTKVIRN
jgi:hypothetical protein